MTMQFKKATKQQAKLRMAIHGPSGAGKTFSALSIATQLGSKIALIDTERGSAAKYSDKFNFDTLEIIDSYHPRFLAEALEAAAGYDVVIVDSLTHFWNGPGGMLELVDEEVKKMKARNQKPDSFAAWKSIDPIYRRVVQHFLSTPYNLIVTMRAKTEYEKVEENGKTKIKKLGMAPQMRGEFEYEMDVEGMMDIDHNFVIGKHRLGDLLDGKVFTKPGKDLADILKSWLSSGAPAAQPAPVAPPPATPTPPPSAPESGPKAVEASPQEPAAATKCQQHQTDILGAATRSAAKTAYDASKKDPLMRGQYADACKKAFSKRWRELPEEPARAAS